ncbi:MAG: hypothetical protein EPO51_20375 [Phenylobacterium sp.]|uniref:hypothetical protein n=1 Tax=Phenylobacterium sp. TaxID=1871053 RepID=UPI001207D0A9|nr:hypothetical protein [Phenylobacterium sp.]TAJ69885.1 MAG: hypothetical protein EPO51_20375 [Phenylobacterium sp.]
MNVISTELPGGWRWVVDPQERRSLELELAREMPPKHLLFGRSARLLARHERRDDFLFRVGENEVAQVHLTWTAETDPFFPHTELHPSLEGWARTGGIMS